MPATFPSHAAAVLPIKARWPRAFDGVALVVGSTAPDQAYALYGRFHLHETHQWPGLLFFCLPMTLIEVWLTRRAAPIVAAHLPNLGPFAVRDYGAIGATRHRWYVIVYSALLGAASHLVWDGLSHQPNSPGWGRNLLPFLNTPSINRWWWWDYAELIWSVLGGIAAVWMFAWIGRRGLVRAWHGAAPARTRMPRLFWSVVVFFLALYPATYPLLGYRHAAHVQGLRILWALCLGLLFAAGSVALVTRLTRPPGRHRAADIPTPAGMVEMAEAG